MVIVGDGGSSRELPAPSGAVSLASISGQCVCLCHSSRQSSGPPAESLFSAIPALGPIE